MRYKKREAIRKTITQITDGANAEIAKGFSVGDCVKTDCPFGGDFFGIIVELPTGRSRVSGFSHNALVRWESTTSTLKNEVGTESLVLVSNLQRCDRTELEVCHG